MKNMKTRMRMRIFQYRSRIEDSSINGFRAEVRSQETEFRIYGK